MRRLFYRVYNVGFVRREQKQITPAIFVVWEIGFSLRIITFYSFVMYAMGFSNSNS